MTRFRSLIPCLFLFAAPIALAPPASAQIGIGVSINIAPPELPVYEQPPIPEAGFLWTPGYWAYGDVGYYWIPGTWVRPPSVGVLWTPPYWGLEGGVYGFHAGYWGPHVGFYGGVNYGFGYGGSGFEGGEWRNGGFAYNRSVTNIGSTHITNVYNRTVINNNTSRVAFNGEGGVRARPSPDEERAIHEHHVDATPEQTQHEHTAHENPDLRASTNHGKPAIAATSKPGEFKGAGVVKARDEEKHDADEKKHIADEKQHDADQHHSTAEKHDADVSKHNADEKQHDADVKQHDAAEHKAPAAGNRAVGDEHKAGVDEHKAPAAEHKLPPSEHKAPAAEPKSGAEKKPEHTNATSTHPAPVHQQTARAPAAHPTNHQAAAPAHQQTARAPAAHPADHPAAAQPHHADTSDKKKNEH